MWLQLRTMRLLVVLVLLCVLASDAAQRTRRPRRQNSRRQRSGTRRSPHTIPEPPELASHRPRPPACEERLTLEEREERANFVFTGRVEWLTGGRNRVTRHIVGDEGVAGGVRVKRVFKGRPELAGRILQVNGLGGSSVCNSHARVKDTRIFLTRIDDEGKIVLNSSLVRLTLKNLRKTVKAVQDVPYEHQPPIHEIRNPCHGRKCHHGAICVGTGDGRSARCECPIECHLYGGGTGPGASGGLEPICGSDGKDYDSECQLRRHACNAQKHLEVRYYGKCDPCEGVSCPERQSCQLDRDRRPVCRCNDICSKEYDPVCASDGETYTNECAMKVEACKERKSLAIIYRGACDIGLNPCDGISCMAGEQCNIDTYGIARCECPPRCEAVVKPVCGTDGDTYDNICELQRAVCVKQVEISVRYVGVCGEEGPCAGHECGHGGVCVERQGRPVCECPQCPAQLDHVCGTDGISYDNECHLRAEACRIHRNLTVRYRGKCSGCEDKQCDYYGICEADTSGVGRCVCPEGCVKVESPVCGTDGETYINECVLKVAGCLKQQFILVASRGDCDLCQHVVCKFGGRCEAGRCVCPSQCPDTREPVCASNGETYSNECEMQKAACGIENGLRVTFVGECSEARTSGVNFELTPCNGDLPLVNPATGRDFYCGKGPDTENCPSSYYCHYTLSFAKCCPLDQAENGTVMGPLCRQESYGCCPDGKTTALGPNYAGCPSICQCHKLGAHDEVCDPVTNQCPCKPGVGGTKCDRCEPGFWGLPRIQRGSTGCLPCGCSLFGSVRDDCEQMTGQCVCKPGIRGKKMQHMSRGPRTRPKRLQISVIDNTSPTDLL